MRGHHVAIAILLAGLFASASGSAEERPRGLIGARGGFVLHSGRSIIVDTLTSASTKEDTDAYTKGSVMGGVAADLGIVWFGPGDFGIRLLADAATPGPFYAFTAMPRYRWHIHRARALEPWLGVGLGVDFKDEIADPFISFPIAGGCDIELARGLFLTTEATVTMINPWGPSRTEMTTEGLRKLEDHLDRIALLVGMAYTLY